MGAVKREIQSDKDAHQVLETFASILTNIGELKILDKNELKLLGRMKFGLQSVPIKIRIRKEGNTTSVQILAWSDDIWSHAAKNSISRIMEFYKDPLKKIKEEDITGLKPFYIGLIVSSFFLVLKWTTNLIESYNLWNYAIIFGAVVITYFIISRIRFNQL